MLESFAEHMFLFYIAETNMAEDDKRRLEKTVSALQARFGMRAVRRLGQDLDEPLPRLATGFTALDKLLGGGLPRGRITEIAGSPTSGMATLALKTIAQAQAQGEMAIYLDLEQTFDPAYAARCGVIMEQLILIHPYNAQQGFAVLEEFAAGDVGVLVCDLPLRILSAPPLLQALSTTLERLLAPLGKSTTVLICLLSLPSAAPATYAQSVALPHYATVRLLISRERWIYRRRDIHGYRVQVRVVKNKLRPTSAAGTMVEVDIVFDEGPEGGDP